MIFTHHNSKHFLCRLLTYFHTTGLTIFLAAIAMSNARDSTRSLKRSIIAIESVIGASVILRVMVLNNGAILTAEHFGNMRLVLFGWPSLGSLVNMNCHLTGLTIVRPAIMSNARDSTQSLKRSIITIESVIGASVFLSVMVPNGGAILTTEHVGNMRLVFFGILVNMNCFGILVNMNCHLTGLTIVRPAIMSNARNSTQSLKRSIITIESVIGASDLLSVMVPNNGAILTAEHFGNMRLVLVVCAVWCCSRRRRLFLLGNKRAIRSNFSAYHCSCPNIGNDTQNENEKSQGHRRLGWGGGIGVGIEIRIPIPISQHCLRRCEQ